MMRPTSIGSRLINLPTIQKGEAMSATEVAHRLRISRDTASNVLRYLVGRGMMENGRRGNGITEYWMAKSSAAVIKMPWLRPTGMRITAQYREDRGIYSA